MVMPWENKTESPTKPAASGVPLDKLRLAVLPFSNISPDPNDDYFADGMTEELISTISKISGLQVIARTSVLRYKDGNRGIDEIAAGLKAGTILEGSVRKAGNRIRISLQLIDSNSQSHLWSESYDKNLEDIFGIQTDIAEKVADALKSKLLSEERRTLEHKAKPEAYLEYLRGLYFYHRSQLEEKDTRAAIRHFERAIELDSKYGAAIAGLSLCHTALGYWGYMPKDEAFHAAKDLALKALKLDDGLPEAHLALGEVAWDLEWKWAEAGMEFKKALELNPSYIDAHRDYGLYLLNMGQADKAMLQARKLIELDPLSSVSQLVSGDILALAGKYSEALLCFEKAQEMNPNSEAVYLSLGVTLAYIGKINEALKLFEKAVEVSEGSLLSKCCLGYAYATSGRRDDALKIKDEIVAASREMSPYFASLICAGLNEKEEALDFLEEAYAKHAIGVSPLPTLDPMFANLRLEPRFKELAKKLNLSE
jgi:TolB-like protein/Flp pilus assembly protein TadD